MKTIIIGGGASGLVAAINASNKDNEVIILERNNSCGKKILVTGNGHCNYFHEDISKNNYHSEYKDLKILINEKNIDNTLRFLNSIGIVPKIKDGYYYPYSNQAVSVLNALLDEVNKRKIKIFNNTFVKDIRKEANTFIIATNNGEYKADKVIVAVGGNSYPKSGSDGNLYKILEKLGHSIIKPLPALVGLITKENIKDLKGIRTEVMITLFEDGKEVRKEEGELQHNETGISGICVMQLSNRVVRGIENNKKEEISINYVKSLASNKEEFMNFLYTQNKLLGGTKISSLLDQVLNYKLTNYFLKILNIPNIKLEVIDKEKLIRLCEMITNFKLTIIGDKGFSSSQVTSGGVALSDVCLTSLESKHRSNLYFCGEVLDVSGDCGGYNLAFAFLTGVLAGNSAKDKI